MADDFNYNFDPSYGSYDPVAIYGNPYIDPTTGQYQYIPTDGSTGGMDQNLTRNDQGALGVGGSAGGNSLSSALGKVPWGAVVNAGAGIVNGIQQRQAGQQNQQAATDMRNLMSSQWQQGLQYDRPNQVGPWGSTMWTTDPKTGQMTQTSTLNDKDQANLDAMRGVAGQRLGAAGGIDLSYLSKADPSKLDPQSAHNAEAAGLLPSGSTPGTFGGSFLTSGLYKSPARDKDYR